MSGLADPLPDWDHCARRGPRNFVFQFDHAPAEIVEAFGDPRRFNDEHTEHWLAYLTYFFHARERLLETMKDPDRLLTVIKNKTDATGLITTIVRTVKPRTKSHARA